MTESVIAIKDTSSVSALGKTKVEIDASYDSQVSKIRLTEIEGGEEWACPISLALEEELRSIVASDKKYQSLDRSVLFAILAARALFVTGLENASSIALAIGSSRGATSVFEKSHEQFLKGGKVPVLTSPTTTLGNISSWVMQELKLSGFEISNSVTCSTALQSILSGVAWLSSGMASHFIAGASEAPLTQFTISQMKALRIYASDKTLKYPCMPCAIERPSSAGMVLGEGAALFVLEKMNLEKAREEGRIIVEGFGYASEQISHPTSMSHDGKCLFDSMSAAVKSVKGSGPIDAVILHAPGTDLGDEAEITAVKKVFSEKTPIITSNKWILGHTFGAAGAFNMEYALSLLRTQKVAEFPYRVGFQNHDRPIEKIMVNAAGFGGNAVSIILRRA